MTHPLHDLSPNDDGWLREQWSAITARWRLLAAVFLLCVAAAAVRSLLTPRSYEGSVRLLIEREAPKVVSFRDVAEVDSGRDDYYQTQYKLLQSRALARRLIEERNLLDDPDFGGPRDAASIEEARTAPAGQSPVMESAIDQVLSRVRVQPDRNSRLVAVSVESGRADVAALLANELARLFIEQSLEFRYRTSAEATRWLTSQIEEQRRRIDEVEAALRGLRERDGVASVEERRGLLEQKFKELGSAATTLKTQRLQKEALYRQMTVAANPEDLPEVMGNPVIQSLRIELATLGSKEAQLLESYLDQHPEVVRVRRQIEETRRRLSAEARRVLDAARNDYLSASAQEASVVSALEAAKAESLDLSRGSVEYDAKKRDLDAAKAVLESLLARSKETDVTQELRASNIRVVDPAVVPRRPVRPNLRADLFLGSFLGLGLGLALVLLLNHLDNTIKTPEDVRHHVREPLLAVIPEAAGKNGSELVLVNGQATGPFVEGYRVLRTALAYSWPEPKPRVIAVTSTVPSEGKTLTSLNLAFVMAAARTRVLLIDADLRRPRIHEALSLGRAPGLSDVLVGQADPFDCIRPVPGTAFHLLPSGTSVPSPADLLTGVGLKQLLDAARTRYDWIIVDTPPLTAVADPLTVAPLVDGVVVVAGAEMTSRSALRETVHQLSRTGGRVLGVLLNRASLERHSYYHGSYHYAPARQEEAAR